MNPRALHRSLSFRVTAAFVAFVIAGMTLLLGGLFWFSVQIPRAEVQNRIESEAVALGAVAADEGREALIAALDARRARPDPHKAFHVLLDAQGRRLSGNLPSWPAEPWEGWASLEADLYRDGDEIDYEALSLNRTLDDGLRLILARDVEAIEDRREMIEEGGLWGIVGMTLFGLAGGWIISRIISHRLERINRAALDVMEGNLAGRVEIGGSGDDFDQLSRTLNRMLDRIEELVASVSRVSDSVAHELRTPLTRLRAILEEAADANPSGSGPLIEQAIEEAQRLQHIFEALLRIARLETGGHGPVRRPVALAGLLDDAIELYRPEAEAREQRLELETETGLFVEADPDLLFQAVANLLDNAVKFTPRQGRVRMQSFREGDLAVISILDSGAGVDPESRGRLRERFYRAPGARNVPGAGLGLSLVAAVAAAHGWRLEFPDREEGFEAQLRLSRVTFSIKAT